MDKVKRAPYYIGLDMGTSSVGWAVTDEDYKILRGKGKDMWGVRLFDEAQTAAERRTFRVARRRRQREVARIGLLHEYFADAIHEVDPGFFHRLQESKYYLEDRDDDNQQKFALFNDKNFTDKEYYAQYPTIFHLRKELIESSDPHDVRFVYLAILNLFKRRGHFLNKGLSADGGESSMAEAYETLVEEARNQEIILPETLDTQALETCLGEKGLSRSTIKENVMELLAVSKKDKAATELISMMCGLKGALQKIYGSDLIDDEHKGMKISFHDMNYEEEAAEIVALIGEDNFALLEAVKEVHDIGLLAHILEGEQYLSMARVKQYDAHHEDLLQLKRVLKKYDKDGYDKMFRMMGQDNYSAYVGSVNYNENKVRRNGGKGKDVEAFYKNVKKVMDKLPEIAQNDPDVKDIRTKIEGEAFLQKQLTASNGIIPNQVHTRELKAILENASGYLPFLNEKDDSGLTAKERIQELYSFQIPYYVGPLGQQHAGEKGYNVWAKRRPGEEKGRILPWNFEQKIDVNQAAEDFIKRMVRHCTYLKGENTLPKQSLLYEKFMVLNELNNLRIRGEKPSVEVKQEIYETLFMTGKRVTRKQLLKYLVANGLLNEDDGDMVSGIDQDFKASLSSLNKFKGVLGDAAVYDSNRAMIEQIIFWATIYGDDKHFLKNRIKEHYGDSLDDQQIKRICGMKFNGWGNLSKTFLELQGASKEDGVYRSIIQSLWETNDNLMQLMSERYTYAEKLEKMVGDAEKPLSEWKIEDLDDLYLSPSVKRMVWQTLKILNEIVEVRGYAPDKIFVEMVRDSAQTRARNKGKRTQSRKEFLLNVYKEDKEWRKEIQSCEEIKFRKKKIYLYYLQHGKSLYSGKTIDFDTLLSDNDAYDIDHIYPRHFVKDDSLENNLVLCLKSENAKKGDQYPLRKTFDSAVLSSQEGVWKSLLKQKVITKEKYDRLVRTADFTIDELAGFINRQLVETRQGTKAITQILKRVFKNEAVEIIFTKAELISDFRRIFDLPKVRCVNSTHHAHDAYLNIVVGNVYNAKFTKHPRHFIEECQRKGSYDYNMYRMFDYDVKCGSKIVWCGSKITTCGKGTISTVKKQLQKRSVLLTKKSFMKHGKLFAANNTGKESIKSDAYYSDKTTDIRLLDVQKYGGKSDISNTAFALVEFYSKGKPVRILERIPLYLNITNNNDENLNNYISKKIKKDLKNVEISEMSIRMYPIRQYVKLKINGYFYYLSGSDDDTRVSLRDAVTFYLSDEEMAYVKYIEKAVETQNFSRQKNKKAVLSEAGNIKLYEVLIEKLQQGIFLKKKISIVPVLLEGKEKFKALPLEKQCYIIMQIFAWITSNQQGVNLKDIGGASNAGKLKMSKNISDLSEVILIEQSATGLYERRIDLLTV